jgi:hypothetical protein
MASCGFDGSDNSDEYDEYDGNEKLAKAIAHFIAMLPKLNNENDAEQKCIEQIKTILGLIEDVRVRDMLCQIFVRLISDHQGIFRESPRTQFSEHQCHECKKHFEGGFRTSDNFIHSQFVIMCPKDHKEKMVCGDCLTGFTIIGQRNNHSAISTPCNTEKGFQHRIGSLTRYLNCLIINLLDV